MCEKQIRERSLEPDTEIILTSLNAYNENGHLQILIAVRWPTAQTLGEITKEQLNNCVNNRIMRNEDGEHS